ncbi:MAG: hypothetical protein KC766_23795 [Myxococcales bacterium]|nr:hypothetical protein [Myxococcales bacterium]
MKRPSATHAGALLLLTWALLACGGSDSNDCSASLSYQGQPGQASDKDRFAARHAACREACKKAFPGAKNDSDEVNGCASRCSADLLFGKTSATVSCK